MSNNVLFEIGLEELPARFIDESENQLINKTKKWLEELRISYDSIESYSTPRRLAVLIKGLADKQTTIREEVRGPSESIAKDNEGNWSKAAIGFTKGQGKSTDEIYTKEIKGSTYIFVEKHIEGKPTFNLLPSFKKVIESIQFRENMRWAEESLKYARPIRWLVAIYNDTIIPFEIASVETNNLTYGHRFLGQEILLENPLEYQAQLKDNFVIADKNEREQLIITGIKELEEKEQFSIEVDAGLLNEVRNLVEYPTVFCGTYEHEFLNLPSEVLITSMKEHQRYFPVKSTDGKLLPYFVGVRNGDRYEIATVIRGNEKVLRARLSDGQFFYEEDQKQTINYYLEKLDRVVFQEKLGTVTDKVRRVVENAKQLAQFLNVDEETKKKAIRTAEIGKFDLMTNMVNEFTELQGVMGEKYALHFGEDKGVAQAIREHYLPVQANGELPDSLAGSIVSVADKLDTIVGFISVGLTPTGSQDPYSLRRQALGVLRILQDRQWDITLETLLAIAQRQYEQKDSTVTQDIHDFFLLRVGYLLKEMGIEQDVIQAVTHREVGVFPYTIAKASILSDKRNDPEFKDVEEALVRILNLSKDKKEIDIKPDLFVTPSEKLLYEKYQEINDSYNQLDKQQNAMEALSQLTQLAKPIHSFFENNMVMSDDESLRKNRLSLVNNLALLIDDFADLTRIQWKQHS